MIRKRVVKFKNQVIAYLPPPITTLLISLAKALYKSILTFVPYHLREDTMYSKIYHLEKRGFDPDLVVDIGAFIGEWTENTRKIFRGSNFVMIEPQARKSEDLHKMALKYANVSYIKALVADKSSQKVTFYESGTGSSIYREKSKDDLKAYEYVTQTLDHILEKISGESIFLKLDVQGAELDVLRGATKTLLATQVILMEISLIEYNEGAPQCAEVIAFMDNIGYVIYDICDIHRTSEKVAIQVDVLFVKKNFTFPGPMDSPMISIITVTYNAEKYLRPTIESVLNQSFRHFEYLIVDGASTDRTAEIIREYQDRINQVMIEKDTGVYDAMNKGLKLAQGKYVLFLNAGDELSKNITLQEIFSPDSNSDNDTDVIYGETNILNQDRKIIGTRSELTSRKLPYQLTKKDFLNGQVVSHQSFIAKRLLCEPYKLKYKCSADIDWMLQVISQSDRIINVNQPISNYLQGGISDKQLGRCWRERFLILMKYFDLFSVIVSHFRFAVRFLEFGRYKTEEY